MAIAASAPVRVARDVRADQDDPCHAPSSGHRLRARGRVVADLEAHRERAARAGRDERGDRPIGERPGRSVEVALDGRRRDEGAGRADDRGEADGVAARADLAATSSELSAPARRIPGAEAVASLPATTRAPVARRAPRLPLPPRSTLVTSTGLPSWPFRSATPPVRVTIPPSGARSPLSPAGAGGGEAPQRRRRPDAEGARGSRAAYQLTAAGGLVRSISLGPCLGPRPAGSTGSPGAPPTTPLGGRLRTADEHEPGRPPDPARLGAGADERRIPPRARHG